MRATHNAGTHHLQDDTESTEGAGPQMASSEPGAKGPWTGPPCRDTPHGTPARRGRGAGRARARVPIGLTQVPVPQRSTHLGRRALSLPVRQTSQSPPGAQPTSVSLSPPERGGRPGLLPEVAVESPAPEPLIGWCGLCDPVTPQSRDPPGGHA